MKASEKIAHLFTKSRVFQIGFVLVLILALIATLGAIKVIDLGSTTDRASDPLSVSVGRYLDADVLLLEKYAVDQLPALQSQNDDGVSSAILTEANGKRALLVGSGPANGIYSIKGGKAVRTADCDELADIVFGRPISVLGVSYKVSKVPATLDTSEFTWVVTDER